MVVYAIGDSDGDASDQIRVGIASKRSFPTMVKNFAIYRAHMIVAHVEAYIRGETAALRFKSEIEHRLTADGRNIRASWWRASGEFAAALAREVAESEHVDVMTEGQASDLERAKLIEKMERFA